MERCVMEGNKNVGAQCMDGAVLHVEHCHTSDNTTGYSCAGGQLKLAMCSSLRDCCGVIARHKGEGTTISLEQVFVRQSSSCGCVVRGNVKSLMGA